jgi:hypothetical protein
VSTCESRDKERSQRILSGCGSMPNFFIAAVAMQQSLPVYLLDISG